MDNDIVGTGVRVSALRPSIWPRRSAKSGLDLAAATNAGRAFVLEVMGRNAGWLAAACALAAEDADAAPHIILMPEVVFDETRFLARVQAVVERAWAPCAVVVAERHSRAGRAYPRHAGS